MPQINPSQEFVNLLDFVSGYDPMHALQFTAAVKAGETIPRGGLCSIDSNGEMLAGLSSDNAMPMFAINADTDFDAAGVPAGNTYDVDSGQMSGGAVGAAVATGGYELATTAFEATGTYAPNTLLIQDATVASKVNALVGNAYSESVVGVVSVPAATGLYDQSLLRFWPVYLPKYTP